MSKLADEDLVFLAARSHDGALAELYDRYGQLAYRLALRVAQDRALAEDAVQEAFLSLWRSARGFARGRANARTWILMLVHRRAVDLVRREERRRVQPIVHAELSGTPADDDVALQAERQWVQDALRRLRDDERETLTLAYYGGLTQAQLAEQLGVPLGTIKSRMFTGLGRLREILATGRLEAGAFN